MRIRTLISIFIMSLILSGFFLSCDNAREYYIKALIDGTEYDWKLGLTEIEDDAFGMVETGTPDTTSLFATPAVETGLTEPFNYVDIRFAGTTVGTYTIFDMMGANYHLNGVGWNFTDITFEVTTFEGVGGVIIGTFSGTIEESGDSNTMTVEDGQFRVIRVPDDMFIDD